MFIMQTAGATTTVPMAQRLVVPSDSSVADGGPHSRPASRGNKVNIGVRNERH